MDGRGREEERSSVSSNHQKGKERLKDEEERRAKREMQKGREGGCEMGDKG